jgi:cell division protein YceG involved in septum cleavage
MTSEKIARLLQDNGLVESATDFDKWLKSNKYSSKLHYGTMKLKKGMTYEELAKELTTQGR